MPEFRMQVRASQREIMCASLRVLLFLTLLLPAVQSPGSAQTGQEPRSEGREKQLRIQHLRAMGEYDEAAQVSRNYTDEVLQRPGTSPRQAAELTTLTATLELIMTLPAWAQAEMAQADSLIIEWAPIWHAGKYSIAAELLQRRLEILRRHLGGHHREVADCLHYLASSVSHAGDYARAEPLFHEALEMRLDLLGRAHLDVARTLEYLGQLYASVGKNDRAEQLYKEALSIGIAVNGQPANIENTRSDTIRLWARMAKLHIDQGDYAKAMPWLRNGLAAFRGHWRTENWLTAMLLNHQAIILLKQGDHTAAKPLFREALSMRRTDLGAEHPHSIQSLNALGITLSQCGAPDVAEPLMREALQQFNEIHDKEHPDTASALLSLAKLMRLRGEYQEADALCHEALSIFRLAWGDEHVDVAECLHQLALTQMAQAKLRDAEANFRNALVLYRRLLGSVHPDVVGTLYDLARCLLTQGRPDVAEPLLIEAAAAFESARLRVGDGYARATFQASPYATLAATRLLQGKESEAWPAAERAHGRALADLLATAGRRSLSPAEWAAQESLRWGLGKLEGEVAALHEAARSDTSEQRVREVNVARGRLAQAEAAWCNFQGEIASRHPVTEGQAFSLQRIQNALADRTALVGWLQVDIDRAESVAWGYIISNRGPVKWVRLDPTRGPDDVLTPAERARDFRDALALASSWMFRATSVVRIKGEASRLWARWVAPLDRNLMGIEHLVVVPSGPMLGIPLEALVGHNDQYLSGRFTVSYAPSATTYTWLCERGLRPAAKIARRALLVGDPPFTAEQLIAIEKERELTGSDCEERFASAAPLLRTTVLRSALAGHEKTLASLPRLPWTRKEVERVASVIPTSTILLGPDASEQQLSHMAESGALRAFDTIHLATHALVDDARPERSGLVLSRADLPDPHEAIVAGTRIYDGLLTAKDIVREWDLDADLVTLSGCQTGLGRETAGEGYIGLANAFLQAGARSLLVSLWMVEEEATTLLMGRFYENLTGAFDDERAGIRGEPMSKSTALREAKHWLQSYTDTRGHQPFRHPTYWSGFVLIGEP